MKQKTYSWSSGDKRKIFARCWRPEDDAGKTILMVHGLGEHSDRYRTWAEKFTTNGYSFLAIDLRGHGRSAGKRGHAKSLGVLLDDIDLLYNKATRLFPENKLILYGQSMGGNLVLNHVISRNRPIDALIVTSPWLRLYRDPSYAVTVLASIAKKFYPSLTVRTPLRPENFSHDPAVVKDFLDDPLVHDRISLRLYFELYNAGLYALRNVYKINYPFLLMHGTEDKITSSRASRDYVMNTGNKTRLKLWEGQYHELHQELIRDDVFEYIMNWLKEYNL